MKVPTVVTIGMWATIGSVGVAQAYRQLGFPYEKRWHTNTEHSEAASIPVAEDTTQSTSIMGPTTTTPQNTMTIEESTTMSEDCDTSTSQVSILPIFKKIDDNTFLNIMKGSILSTSASMISSSTSKSFLTVIISSTTTECDSSTQVCRISSLE